MDLPKPSFPYIGRMYHAVISQGFNPGGFSMEVADTVIRNLKKTSWANENQDLIRLWTLGGDNWSTTIKEVRSYSGVVNRHKKEQKSKNKTSN
jgi:hypothetical protein